MVQTYGIENEEQRQRTLGWAHQFVTAAEQMEEYMKSGKCKDENELRLMELMRDSNISMAETLIEQVETYDQERNAEALDR